MKIELDRKGLEILVKESQPQLHKHIVSGIFCSECNYTGWK